MAIRGTFGRVVAGVLCKRNPGRRKYTVTNEIVFMKADTEFIEIENSDLVVDLDGNPVKPDGRFWRTASTIDPYHVIVDMH